MCTHSESVHTLVQLLAICVLIATTAPTWPTGFARYVQLNDVQVQIAIVVITTACLLFSVVGAMSAYSARMYQVWRNVVSVCAHVLTHAVCAGRGHECILRRVVGGEWYHRGVVCRLLSALRTNASRCVSNVGMDRGCGECHESLRPHCVINIFMFQILIFAMMLLYLIDFLLALRSGVRVL